MKTPPTFSTTLDPISNKLQNDTFTIRLIPLIEDYNPYYPGFDPCWDANCYNQHHRYFYHNFNKPNQDIEIDSYESDQVLNTVLAKTRVDQWQHSTQLTQQTTHPNADDKFLRVGPYLSLATAVAARFANTLVTRTREPDYKPLTINLGLKYNR